MTLRQLDESLNLIFLPIPKGKRNRPGSKHSKTSITIHNTDNTSKGADALAHARFVANTGYYIHQGKRRWVSWHYTVDEKRVAKHLPVNERAYHAGTQANDSSIGIEICLNADMDFERALDRAARLTALLCIVLDLPTSAVVPHQHWTGKNCPSRMLENGKMGSRWNGFISKVKAYITKTSKDQLLESAEPETIQMADI